VAALLVAALSVTACGGSNGADAEVTVVATTSILGDVVASIAGDAAEVEVLIEPGQGEHTFQASPQQVRSIQRADLVVAFGLGLEAGLQDVLSTSGGDRVLEVGPLVDPIPFDDTDGVADDDHTEDDDDHASEEVHGPDDGHDHDGFDPHVWLDPVRMATAAEAIADALVEVSSDDMAVGIRDRAMTTITAIMDAHDQADALLSAVPADRRLLVTDHEAMSYFAERYGFRLIGSLLPGTSTDAAASAESLADLIDRVEELQIPAIFVDATASDRLARTLEAEVPGLQVVALYVGSLGPPDSGATTYPDLVIENARRVADALD
jgi:zinc/manganese transport system substrate-binding protein